MPKQVCFVTLSRSDYASLRPVIRAAYQDSGLKTTVVAGGSHLIERFGNSIEEIKKDLINIDAVIDFLDAQDNTEIDIARAFGRAYVEFVEYFHEARPDAVFILGDRWEMLAVATAASLLRIPIVHHSGGDITQGSLDNQTRYALSVLAHIHLVAIDEHRERLLRLGEQDWRVISVGEPALTELPQKAGSDPRAELGLRPATPFVLATYHPTTFDELSIDDQVRFFVSALEFVDQDIVLSAPNPDPGSRTFYNALNDFAKSHPRVHLFENIGADRYHAAMHEADYMIGNSSSGIWEAPSFGLPVINIGKRQQDRLRADNVVDVELDLKAVEQAIATVSAMKSRPGRKSTKNPYVKDNTLQLILDAIKLDIPKPELLAKLFVDPLKRR